jgi:hypothetical protein
MPRSPEPIDPRGPRFNQAVVSGALLVGFVGDWRLVVPGVAALLLVGAVFGPRWNPLQRLYAAVIRPRLAPPASLEDPRAPRFASAVGVAFLAASTVAFLAGSTTLGWVLAIIVAFLAGLAAATGICVGCEVYMWTARRRGVRLVA